MLGEKAVRLTGILALLMASTIQGMTPDADSVVSPLASRWLRLLAAGVDRDAALGRIPDTDRPPPPIDAHHDEAPDEVVLPLGAGDSTILYGRADERHGRALTSTGAVRSSARPGPPLAGHPHIPPTPTTDPITSLCRMIC
jgi:hypothetical protein